MEEALHQRIVELNKCRSDYDDLFEKFKQTNLIFDEKENLYKARVKDLENLVNQLSSKNYHLEQTINAYKQSKKSIQKDVKMLEEATRLLELREHDMSGMLASSQRSNSHLVDEINELKERNRVLLEEREAATRMMHDEMISKQEYEILQQRLTKVMASMEADMVARIQYDQVIEENKILKKRMLNDMVDSKEYDLLLNRFQSLERRLPFDFVTKEEYNKLQQANYHLLDDKKVLEESARLVEEIRDSNLKHQAENEAKITFLKNRLEQSEGEMTSLRKLYDRLQDENLSLKNELLRSETARRETEDRIQGFEVLKGQLQLQLSQARLAVRHEQEAKQVAVDEKVEAERLAERAHMEFSQKLIESNQKMQEVFAQTEDQLRRRLAAMDEEVLNLNANIQTLHAERLHLKEEIHHKDKEVYDAKTQVQVMQAHLESNSRESADLRNTIIHLQEEKAELHQQVNLLRKELDDLKALIFSELHPKAKPILTEDVNISSSPPLREMQIMTRKDTGTIAHSKEESLLPPTPAPPLRPPSPNVRSPVYLEALEKDFQMIHDGINIQSVRSGRSLGGTVRSMTTTTTTPLVPPVPPSTPAAGYQSATKSSAQRSASHSNIPRSASTDRLTRVSSLSPSRRMVRSSSFSSAPGLPVTPIVRDTPPPSIAKHGVVPRINIATTTASPSVALSRVNQSPHHHRSRERPAHGTEGGGNHDGKGSGFFTSSPLNLSSPSKSFRDDGEDSLAMDRHEVVQSYAAHLNRLVSPDDNASRN